MCDGRYLYRHRRDRCVCRLKFIHVNALGNLYCFPKSNLHEYTFESYRHAWHWPRVNWDPRYPRRWACTITTHTHTRRMSYCQTEQSTAQTYLVHTSIGKQKSGIIVRNSGGRRHKNMAIVFKVFDKGSTDLVSGPLCLSSHNDCKKKCCERERERKKEGEAINQCQNKEKIISHLEPITLIEQYHVMN